MRNLFLKIPKIPDIKKEEITSVIVELLEVVRYQSEAIQILRNEIAVLKGDKKPPKIKPSKLDKVAGGKGGSKGKKEKELPREMFHSNPPP